MSQAADVLLRALEQEMGSVVRRVRRVIAERARAVDPDLQAAGYLVLGFLADEGPARAADVVEALDIDKGAVSRQVQHLEELGLVARQPDPEDGRAVLLNATSAALDRLAGVAAERRDRLAARLADWDESELDSFVTTLARYNRALS